MRCSRRRRRTTPSTECTTSSASSLTRSTRTATCRSYLFSPYFSSEEKKKGIGQIVEDADPRLFNFLELLAERHRMPALFRIRREFDSMWAEENRLLPVSVTSAVELDQGIVEDIGREIEKQTGRRVELSSSVDPDVLGGLRVSVGNLVLDATVRNRLEQLRKQVARAA